MRGTNYTYYISCFLILLLIKGRLGTFLLLTTCLLCLLLWKQKIRLYVVYINKKKGLNLYKIIILVEKLNFFNNKWILFSSSLICDLFDI